MRSAKSTNIITKKYAQAFVNACEVDGYDIITQEVCEIINIIESCAELKQIVTKYALDDESILSIWREIIERLNFSKKFMNLIKLLVKNKRVIFFEDILRTILNKISEKKGEKYIKIIVASALSQDKKNLIKALFEKIYGTNVIINYDVDDNILNGMIIQIDSMMIDASGQNKLMKIKKLCVTAI